jgi:Tfp pilus assembly protein PilO
MRNLILQLLKNQRYLFITVFGGLIILFTSWYFLVQKGLSKEHKRSSNARIVLEKDVDKFRRMESQIIGLEAEWNDINSQFEMVIDKIPDKRLFDNVTDFLYSMIVNQGLKIQSFSPSNAAIEKKTILVPETGDEITIEKVPIDITLRGSFINFGQLLESMKIGKYRITASNIEILQKQKASAQTIKLISYAYFQSSNNKPLAQATTTPIIKKKNAQTTKAVNQSNDTIKKVEPTKVVDNNVKTIDSLEGVPEMWLEPATEPVEESIVAEKPAPNVKPREKKQKPIKPKEIVNPPVKEEADQEVIPEKAMPFVEKMVVLESLGKK